MRTFTLDRSSLGPDLTPGVMECLNGDGGLLSLATLELPWRSNAPNVSCIPPGTYRVVYAWSGRWNTLIPHLLNVPHRDLIEIHPGNTTRDTDGCILVGMYATPTGVGNSRAAFARLNAWLGLASREGVQLTISNPPEPAVLKDAA